MALDRDTALAPNAAIELFTREESPATQFPAPNAEPKCAESAAFEIEGGLMSDKKSNKKETNKISKKEMIRIHFTLVQVKLFLEEELNILGIADELDFRDYDELNISPVHFYKSREEHKKAILILCCEILAALSKYRAQVSADRWQAVKV